MFRFRTVIRVSWATAKPSFQVCFTSKSLESPESSADIGPVACELQELYSSADVRSIRHVYRIRP
jgi:hypothetical protein